MSFASQLQTAKGDLTARQVASAVSPLLSVRTVEEWLAGRRSPPAWTHEWILSRVHMDRIKSSGLKSRCRKCHGDGQVEIQSGPYYRSCDACGGSGQNNPIQTNKPAPDGSK